MAPTCAANDSRCSPTSTTPSSPAGSSPMLRSCCSPCASSASPRSVSSTGWDTTVRPWWRSSRRWSAAVCCAGTAARRLAHRRPPRPDRPRPGLSGRRLTGGLYPHAMAGGTLYITGNPEVRRAAQHGRHALLIGMLLDQQVPMEWAFAGPATLRERLGHLDADRDRRDGPGRVRRRVLREAGDPSLPGVDGRSGSTPCAARSSSEFDGERRQRVGGRRHAAPSCTGGSAAARLRRREGQDLHRAPRQADGRRARRAGRRRPGVRRRQATERRRHHDPASLGGSASGRRRPRPPSATSRTARCAE